MTGDHATFDGKQFTLTDLGSLVAEASEIQMRRIPRVVTLLDVPEPGQNRTYEYAGADENGDDVAGWQYEQIDGRQRMLIIND